MNDSTRCPKYVDIVDIVSHPDLQCIGDDVVCCLVRDKIIAWQFYDNLKTGSRLEDRPVVIPVARTIRRPLAHQYWRYIQNDSLLFCIQFYPPAMHPSRQKKAFDPKWFCWETLSEMHHVITNRIRFTSHPLHFVDLDPTQTDSTQIEQAAKSYAKSLVSHRGIFIVGPRENAELQNLISLVTERPHTRSNYFDWLKCDIKNGNTTIEHVEKSHVMCVYEECNSTLVKEVLDKYKCGKVPRSEVYTNCSIPGTFIYAAPFEKGIREVESKWDYGSRKLTLDVSHDCKHACIRWKGQHALLLDICIAMSTLQLPPYVMLWIVDFIDTMWIQSHHHKIDLIHSVRDSIQRVLTKRTEQTKRINTEN